MKFIYFLRRIFPRRMLAFAGILLSCLPSYPQTQTSDDIKIDSIPKEHELQEVVVTGIGSQSNHKIGRLSVSGAEINKTPTIFGEKDALKALQSSAGVVAGTEGFAGLYVRGGETDQNLYLLDGLPLLNVYHFGGLFSTFPTYSIDNIGFYKGAFPSTFSERVSGIVDQAMNRPHLNNTYRTFSIGIISVQ